MEWIATWGVLLAGAAALASRWAVEEQREGCCPQWALVASVASVVGGLLSAQALEGLVWLGVTWLLMSFALLGSGAGGGAKKQEGVQAGLSTVFVGGVALVAGAAAGTVPWSQSGAVNWVSGGLVLVGFAVVCGVFPFHRWGMEVTADRDLASQMILLGVWRVAAVWAAVPLLSVSAEVIAAWRGELLALAAGGAIWCGILSIGLRSRAAVLWVVGSSLAGLNATLLFTGVAGSVECVLVATVLQGVGLTLLLPAARGVAPSPWFKAVYWVAWFLASALPVLVVSPSTVAAWKVAPWAISCAALGALLAWWQAARVLVGWREERGQV